MLELLPELSEVRATLCDLDATRLGVRLAAFAVDVWTANIGERDATDDAESTALEGYDDDQAAATYAGCVLLAIAVVAAERLRPRQGAEVGIDTVVRFDHSRRWPEGREINVARRAQDGVRLRIPSRDTHASRARLSGLLAVRASRRHAAESRADRRRSRRGPLATRPHPPMSHRAVSGGRHGPVGSQDPGAAGSSQHRSRHNMTARERNLGWSIDCSDTRGCASRRSRWGR